MHHYLVFETVSALKDETHFHRIFVRELLSTADGKKCARDLAPGDYFEQHGQRYRLVQIHQRDPVSNPQPGDVLGRNGRRDSMSLRRCITRNDDNIWCQTGNDAGSQRKMHLTNWTEWASYDARILAMPETKNAHSFLTQKRR